MNPRCSNVFIASSATAVAGCPSAVVISIPTISPQPRTA